MNKTLQDLQLKHMDLEHKMLKDNLDVIQKTLEQFHDDEHQLRIQLAPVSNGIMIGKYSQGIEEIITEKKKEFETQKGADLLEFFKKKKNEEKTFFFFFLFFLNPAAANQEFQDKLKTHQENVAKLNNPNAGGELSAEEKKKCVVFSLSSPAFSFHDSLPALGPS